MKITVLRLGHRKERDKRITTHCALVSRAFGANEIILSGEYDENVLKTVEKVQQKWGGKFKISYEKNPLKVMRNFKGLKLHLTFYGLQLHEEVSNILKSKPKNILIVIGAEKVPREFYENADYNLSVTSQPHSEVGALAIALHELFQGKELSAEFQSKLFKNAEIKITPSAKGKRVVEKKRGRV